MSARTYVSGHCGPDRSAESHRRCTGQYAGTVCTCRCGHRGDEMPGGPSTPAAVESLGAAA